MENILSLPYQYGHTEQVSVLEKHFFFIELLYQSQLCHIRELVAIRVLFEKKKKWCGCRLLQAGFEDGVIRLSAKV